MSTVLTSYREAISFRTEGFNPIPLAGDERLKVLLTCFEPRQFIPVHEPSVDLVLFVLEGEGLLIAGNREEPITPGTIAFIGAGEARGIMATTRLVLGQVVSPPPTEADHAKVKQGLTQGTWRPDIRSDGK